MRFSLATVGLRHALEALAPVTQVSNSYVDHGTRTVSWQSYTPGFQRGVYYPLEYQFLLDRQQYSVLLSDGSFFQFYYSFGKTDKLEQARLAFYPRPISTVDEAGDLFDAAEAALDRSDDGLFDHLYNWAEYLEEKKGAPVNTSHVRMDYDHKVEVHAKSHLQLGAVQEFRLPADFFPLPVAFVELCGGLLDKQVVATPPSLRFAKKNLLSLHRTASLICLGSLI